MRRTLVTGGGGQLGVALAEAFPGADVRPRSALDVTRPFSAEADLVPHATAWTNTDGARNDQKGAERG